MVGVCHIMCDGGKMWEMVGKCGKWWEKRGKCVRLGELWVNLGEFREKCPKSARLASL